MKKKGLSLWIIILIVILILGAGAAGGYLYFYTDLFKKPQELFWKYLSQEKESEFIFNFNFSYLKMNMMHNKPKHGKIVVMYQVEV